MGEPLRCVGEQPAAGEQQHSTGDEPAAGQVSAALATTAAGFGEILREVRDKLVSDHFREEQVARLHGELQLYKEDQAGKAERLVLQELIRLHDSLGKAAALWRRKAPEEVTPERLFNLLDGLRDDVEMALSRHDVVPYVASGDDFDPHRQVAAATVAAVEPAAIGRIATRLRPGFEQRNVLLQKERVAVFTECAAAGGDHSSGGQS
jgi:molecular chaperone GrpE (heat shock protein)